MHYIKHVTKQNIVNIQKYFKFYLILTVLTNYEIVIQKRLKNIYKSDHDIF